MFRSSVPGLIISLGVIMHGNAIHAETPSQCAAQSTEQQCLIDPSDLRTWMENADPLIIDTRSPTDYSRVQIPGSLNLDSNALKTKTYLKQRKFLLLDYPHEITSLIDGCALLTAAGAEGKILVGCLQTWQEQKLPLTGDIHSTQSRMITAKQFVAELGYHPWTILETYRRSGEPRPDGIAAATKDSDIITLQLPTDHEEIKQKLLEHLIPELRKTPLTRIGIIMSEEQFQLNSGYINEILQNNRIPRAFIVEFGIESIEKLLKQNLEILRSPRPNLRYRCG